MNTDDLLIILAAISVGVLYLWKIRSYDIYEKEPFLKLLLIAVLGGIVSVIVSLFIYEFMDVKRDFLNAIFKIGMVEEFSKLAALFILYFIIKGDFNEIVDGIIYITAISLGFAIIENIMYAFNSELPYRILLLRSVYSVLGHISFAGYMGIAFYIHMKVHRNYVGLMVSLFIAALAHGFYDGVLFHEELTFLFTMVFIIIVAIQFWIFRLTMGFSKFKGRLSEYDFEAHETSNHSFCAKCDKSVDSKEYDFWKIEAGICTTCGNYLFDEQNTINLFNYFRPIINYKRFFKKINTKGEITFLDENNRIFFNTKRNYLSANYGDLSNWLDESNINDRKRILKIPVLGTILRIIGLRYISDVKQTQKSNV